MKPFAFALRGAVLSLWLVILVFSRAAANSPQMPVKSPGAERHPLAGYAYPLETPALAEQNPILLRFKFTKALHYMDQKIGGKAESSVWELNDEQRYLPTEEAGIFIVKSYATNGSTFKCDSRGALLQFIRTGAKTNAVRETIEDNGIFPEQPVKIGETWEQHQRVKGIGFSYENEEFLTWKVAGFARVRNHRCVVLEGNETSHRDSENATARTHSERTARRILYFDNELGGIVERVFIYKSTSTTTTKKTGNQRTGSGEGQAIMRLEE